MRARKNPHGFLREGCVFEVEGLEVFVQGFLVGSVGTTDPIPSHLGLIPFVEPSVCCAIFSVILADAILLALQRELL